MTAFVGFIANKSIVEIFWWRSTQFVAEFFESLMK